MVIKAGTRINLTVPLLQFGLLRFPSQFLQRMHSLLSFYILERESDIKVPFLSAGVYSTQNGWIPAE